MRIPHAARTLVRQMSERFPEDLAAFDDVDGFGVYRSVRYEGEAASFLKAADLALSLDPRVQSVVSVEEQVLITFVGDARADHAQPEYPLDSVAEIEPIEDDSEDDGEGYTWDITENDLRAMKVAELRESFPEFADLKKADIIEAVLDEGIVKRL